MAPETPGCPWPRNYGNQTTLGRNHAWRSEAGEQVGSGAAPEVEVELRLVPEEGEGRRLLVRLRWRREAGLERAAVTLGWAGDRPWAVGRDLSPAPLTAPVRTGRGTPLLAGAGALLLTGGPGLVAARLAPTPGGLEARLFLDDAAERPFATYLECIDRLPRAARAAVVFTDHADRTESAALRAVLFGHSDPRAEGSRGAGLLGRGLAITRSFFVWPGPGTLADPEAWRLASWIAGAGGEVALHSISDGRDDNAAIRAGLEAAAPPGEPSPAIYPLPGEPRLWVFESTFFYAPPAELAQALSDEALEKLERGGGLFVGHTYLGAGPATTPRGLAAARLPVVRRPDGALVPQSGAAALVIDPALDEALARLATRVGQGRLVSLGWAEAGDRLRALGDVTVRYLADGGAEVVNRGALGLSGLAVSLPAAGLELWIDGAPAGDRQELAGRTRIWFDLPAHGRRVVRATRQLLPVPLLPRAPSPAVPTR